MHQLSLSSCTQIKNLILQAFACLRKQQKSWSKLLSGSEKTTEQSIWYSIWCLFPADKGKNVRENGTIFWKAAEWSLVTLSLSFQDKHQPVLYFHWGFQHRSRRKEKNPCCETVSTSLCPALDSSHQTLQQLSVDRVPLSENPLSPAVPCGTRLLHPGCHWSCSPWLWQGEKLAGTCLTGALQEQWGESWWLHALP